jgi:glycosyltransferase involved in cell wall biosynthesis
MINTPISACVITLNEERSIGACIDSLRICDEIIVVDAHSSDRTREIARARGVRVVARDWSGHRTQKQFAVSQARNHWIMSIGANERMSPELSSEIVRVRQYGLDEFAGYQIPMRHADGHPDYPLRLFNRRRTSLGGEEEHARVVAYGPVGRLRGTILHDSYRDPDRMLVMANSMRERGARANALRMFLNPAWRVLRALLAERAPAARSGAKSRAE